MSLSGFKKALVVAGFSAFSSMASAALIGPFAGNDCAGTFGRPFADCKIPENIDPNQSPIIIKFDFDPETPETIEINSALFPTIDGSEFVLTGTGGSTGTWTYNPGEGDPAINFFAAKGGPGFNLFSTLGLTDSWSTPINPNNGQLFGLSHLSFYDTGSGGQVPEPTTLLLLGAGLFAAGFARRRVKHN